MEWNLGVIGTTWSVFQFEKICRYLVQCSSSLNIMTSCCFCQYQYLKSQFPLIDESISLAIGPGFHGRRANHSRKLAESFAGSNVSVSGDGREHVLIVGKHPQHIFGTELPTNILLKAMTVSIRPNCRGF